jgi:alginate O-acetyltransferase complex protein AlgI
MIYNSAEFIFFVAFGLFAYWFTPARFRILIIFAMTVGWYGSWNWNWLGLFLVLAGYNYIRLKGFLKQAHEAAAERRFYINLILFNVVAMVILKFIHLAKILVPFSVASRADFDTPYGSSFFIFMIIALVVDTWRKAIKTPPANFAEFFVAVTFFPLLVAGPIARFNNIGPQLKKLGPLTYENIVDGLLIFSFGFAKKTWVGSRVNEPVLPVFQGLRMGFFYLIVGGLLSTFQAYIDFSSYCDMGRGAARCFGIRIEPNFLPFYYAKNPNEFWQRWNISLGTWIRDYFTFPAMLRYRMPELRYAIIGLAFVVIGIWHGLAEHWFYFGMLNAILILTFLYFQNGPFLRKPKLTRALGYFLVFGIFVGNGIFQQEWAMRLIQGNFPNPTIFGSWEDFVVFMIGLKPIIPIVVTILALDFIQEKRKTPEFFVAFPIWIRSLLAVLALLSFFSFESRHRSMKAIDIPPVYFHF